MKTLGKALLGLPKYIGASPYYAAIKNIAETITGAWTFTSAFIVSVTGSTLATFVSTAANPSITLRYNKASAGVANDELPQLNFEGKDSANALVRYGAIDVIVADPTAASVDGIIRILPAVASVETAAASVANGVIVGAPTGSYQGTGTLNATGLFVNGAAVLTSVTGFQVSHFQDQRSNGTVGGLGVASAWTTRTMQTTVSNNITSMSLAGNVVSCPAGTYVIIGDGVLWGTQNCRHRLRNTTDNTTIAQGLNIDPGGGGGNFSGLAWAIVTFASTKNVALQYWMGNTNNTNDLGAPASTGENEVYGNMLFIKIA